jgi:hypothetical protein
MLSRTVKALSRENPSMSTLKRTIAGHPFWFTLEHACKVDPETGRLTEVEPYSCAISARQPGSTIRGELLKDDSGRVKLFPTADQALEAGVKEIEARLRLPARAYAVGLPRAAHQADRDAFASVLRQEAQTNGQPRVEESFGRQWQRVWEDREEAERFAACLRRASGNAEWEVYDLGPPRLGALETDHRSGPVVILIGRHTDGTSFGLHPSSVDRIRQDFPQARLRPNVFIGRETANDSPVGREGVYDQVATLLTGLSCDQLLALGGYRVVDPLTDLMLWKVDPADSSSLVTR